MLGTVPADRLKGKRNRALLALDLARTFRRFELVALDVADLAFEPDGMRVQVQQPKTDQKGQGQEIATRR